MGGFQRDAVVSILMKKRCVKNQYRDSILCAYAWDSVTFSHQKGDTVRVTRNSNTHVGIPWTLER